MAERLFHLRPHGAACGGGECVGRLPNPGCLPRAPAHRSYKSCASEEANLVLMPVW